MRSEEVSAGVVRSLAAAGAANRTRRKREQCPQSVAEETVLEDRKIHPPRSSKRGLANDAIDGESDRAFKRANSCGELDVFGSICRVDSLSSLATDEGGRNSVTATLSRASSSDLGSFDETIFPCSPAAATSRGGRRKPVSPRRPSQQQQYQQQQQQQQSEKRWTPGLASVLASPEMRTSRVIESARPLEPSPPPPPHLWRSLSRGTPAPPSPRRRFSSCNSFSELGVLEDGDEELEANKAARPSPKQAARTSPSARAVSEDPSASILSEAATSLSSRSRSGAQQLGTTNPVEHEDHEDARSPVNDNVGQYTDGFVALADDRNDSSSNNNNDSYNINNDSYNDDSYNNSSSYHVNSSSYNNTDYTMGPPRGALRRSPPARIGGSPSLHVDVGYHSSNMAQSLHSSPSRQLHRGGDSATSLGSLSPAHSSLDDSAAAAFFMRMHRQPKTTDSIELGGFSPHFRSSDNNNLHDRLRQEDRRGSHPF